MEYGIKLAEFFGFCSLGDHCSKMFNSPPKKLCCRFNNKEWIKCNTGHFWVHLLAKNSEYQVGTLLSIFFYFSQYTGKNNGFPFLDTVLGYLKKTHKNPKFGKVKQVPTREFPTKFPDWDLSHSFKFGIFWVFFKYRKISKNGNPLFFPVIYRIYSTISRSRL